MKLQTNLFFILLLIFIVLVSSKKPTKEPENNGSYLIDKGDRVVLPDYIIPKIYDIHIDSKNIDELKFKGEEDILLDILKKTDIIVVHCIDIEIKSAEILNQKVKSIEYNETDEIAILKFKKELPITKNATLSIKFNGKINNEGRGFYYSIYQVDNQDKLIYSTQMEASDARRVFPCFDEPSYKSIFNIKLTVDKNFTAISNSIESRIIENKKDKTKTFEFQPTPKMSTYLVAFVIGDIEFIEDHSIIDKTRVRVYKGRGVKDSSHLALQIAIKTLDFFVDYFNISLPVKKLDLCAIPDFTFYAMENTGLLIFEDIYLLTSDKATLVNNKEMVDMIAHEVSHQWFGNRVTMSWWNGIWLNEGFAEFMGYFASASLYPEWNVWLEFSQNLYNKAMELDSLSSTHPVQLTVRTTSQLAEIFDDICYDKGASIVQMLQNRLGNDNFRNGLRYYLNKYSFQNTVTQDLWDSLSLFSNGLNVSKFIDNYVKYSGYPIISIEQNQDQPNSFSIKQKRFSFNIENDNNSTDSDNDIIWNVFIIFQTAFGQYEFTLDKEFDTFTIPHNLSNSDWIKPNYGQKGFYRIEYNDQLLNPLKPIIKTLPAIDRIGILSDLFSSCKSTLIETSLYMDFIYDAYISNENNGDVLTFIIKSFEEIQNIIFDQNYKLEFDHVFSNFLVDISNSLGFDPKDNEEASITILRDTVNTKLVLLGYEPLILTSKQRYQQSKNTSTPLNPDTARCVLTSVINTGGKVEQNEIIDLYLNSTDIAEKKLYLEVLSFSAPTLELYKDMLTFSITSSLIDTNDIYLLWSTYKPEFKLFAFDFFVDNFEKINSIFKDNMLYPYLTSNLFCNKLNQTQLNEIQNFFINNPVPMAESSIESNLETIQYNYNWFNSKQFNLLNWLNNNGNFTILN